LFLWIYVDKYKTTISGLVLGLSVGMAVLTRPTIAIAAIISYGFLFIHSLVQAWKNKTKSDPFKKLLPGFVLCLLLACLVLKVNYERWGTPFSFLNYSLHENLILNKSRGEAFQKYGFYRFDRIMDAFKYYFIPAKQNFSLQFPFLKFDYSHSGINPQGTSFDWVEPTKMPLLITSPLLFLMMVFFIIYVCNLLRRMFIFNEKDKMIVILFVGTILGCINLLPLCDLAIRYEFDILPLLWISGMSLIIFKNEKGILLNKSFEKMIKTVFLILLILSVYTSHTTLLLNKAYSWGTPRNVKLSMKMLYKSKFLGSNHVSQSDK
ncbi:MAG: hypothetical protein NTZ51_11725, partial [Proteobacteria bacterium]|nr:hypothetical protein [Pseudomonadota bacterium]